MRAIDLVTTVIAIRDAVAQLYRANDTAAVFAAHRVVGATLVRRRRSQGGFTFAVLFVDIRHLRFHLVRHLRCLVRRFRNGSR